MATKKEDKKELQHSEWAEQIAECQSSGMKIKDWCKMKGISCNTYYRRLHVVKMERNEKAEQQKQKIVPICIAEELCGTTVPAASQPSVITALRLSCRKAYRRTRSTHCSEGLNNAEGPVCFQYLHRVRSYGYA